MKTIAKHYSKSGNVSLVQFETLEGEGLPFQVAGAAIGDGRLVIKEIGSGGVVNTLLALNHSEDYLLLTDMDLLTGAKQNRSVNTSVLIAPGMKQEISVSCVERSRWSLDSPDFRPGEEVLDPRMRSSKAGWLREDKNQESDITQSRVWGMINEEMKAARLYSETEDYSEVLAYRKEKNETRQRKFPQFGLREGMNGMAVFHGPDLVFFDVFGNREAYHYYFHKLASGAMQMASDGKAMDEHEAYYRLAELLDVFQDKLDPEEDSQSGGAGKLYWSGLKEVSGFELSFRQELVHLAGMQTG